jgi:NitT/TauT family transport system permease protein
MKSIVSEKAISVASPLILVVVWELCAQFNIIDTRFFPAPTAVIGHLYQMSYSGELWGHLSASLERLAFGLLVGGIPAIFIGLAMGLYRPVYAAVDPLISATYPIPKSSLLPLMLLIFGLGEGSKIVMVAIGAFYPIVINTAAGVRQIPPILLDVGKNFRASRTRMFTTIALPGALPFIMTGVKLGAGMSLVLIAIAEMVGAKRGLGYMIWNAWEIFDVTTMYVGLVIIALIGFILNLVVDFVERLIIPWKQS